MAKSANQKSKLLYLAKLLHEQTDETHALTLREIAEGLEAYGIAAERKTLYDDLEALRLFGMDIETVRDKSVRYYVASRRFELPELKLLVDAVQASRFVTRKKSNELIRKLQGLTSRYGAQKLGRQVYVTNRVKTVNERIYYTVDQLHEAILAGVKIRFQYFDWNEKKEKILRHGGKVYALSPWALTWDDENYYLIAYDSDEARIKHFRVDKMTNLSLTDQARDGGEAFADFDMALYAQKTFGMFSGREELVTLRCANRLAGVVLDRFGGDTLFLKHDEAHFDVRVRVAVSPLFLSWVMNFGNQICVVAPESVRDELVKLAKEVWEQYQ